MEDSFSFGVQFGLTVLHQFISMDGTPNLLFQFGRKDPVS
jgi:hypothetical protein